MIPTLIGCLVIAVLLVLAVVQVAKEEHEVHLRQLAYDRDEIVRLTDVVYTQAATAHLLRARLCIYWSSDLKGFMGLASQGPSASCRIGESADITLRNITAVLPVTPEAVVRWESAPWK